MIKKIYAYWCLSDNFGDKLTPYLIEKMTSNKCIWSPPNSDILKYAVTGSILNWDMVNSVTWGTGIANKDDTIGTGKIVMVRGEISKYRAILSGAENIEVGDPALLLPRYYKPKKTKKYKLGIFAHYIDTDIIAYNIKLPEDVVLIYALDDIEKIIDTICSCERVISSSLHGLIVADAYGIPTKWVKFSDRILGDGTKFMDYYSSIGHDIGTKCIDLRQAITLGGMLAVECDLKEMKIDLDKMINCCPFI